ncbi:unnamed protein product [Ilex paraguariensis]|uniref:Uncharacterized protein n=1 Tax=Ilex paraguariensis TaxID=185542 RepID=A0ABC8TB63_9AQUA
MICQLKKRQSSLDELFVMQHSEMEPVVELLVVCPPSSLVLCVCVRVRASMIDLHMTLDLSLVYHVGPKGWKKLSGDDIGELHYMYYPVEPTIVEQEMTELSVA